MGDGGNGMSVLSDDDSNVGYSDYDGGIDSNSDRESGDNRKISKSHLHRTPLLDWLVQHHYYSFSFPFQRH